MSAPTTGPCLYTALWAFVAVAEQRVGHDAELARALALARLVLHDAVEGGGKL